MLSQVVRPLEPLLRSPPVAAPSDEKPKKDEERRGAGDKREARNRHEDPEPRGERSRGADRRAEPLADTPSESRGRVRDQRESTPPPPPPPPPPTPSALVTGSEDRDTAGSQSHEEGKKKTKSQRKGLKKGRKEEVVGGNIVAAVGDRFKTEPPISGAIDATPPIHSPKKGAKKKVLERKRKRSREEESDVSEEDLSAPQPLNKRKRGPRTPPPSMRPDHRGTGANPEPTPLSKMDNISDWSDDDVADRAAPVETQAPLVPAEPLKRAVGPRVGRDRERCHPPLPIAPLLPQDPPMMLPTLAPQPLMSQALLRKLPPDQTRSSSMGSNQSRTSSRRLRSPSNEPARRDDPQCPRPRRGRLQGANSRDRERERERPVVTEPPGVERKSRIDQLRRGEPGRSTSSGKNTCFETQHLTVHLFVSAVNRIMLNYNTEI